jgi:CBS domain-containing protein
MQSDALTVRDVMQPQPVLVAPECPLRAVMAEMNQRRIGAVVVVRAGDELAGIFTERDLIRRVADVDPGWRDTPVSDWMTSNPHTILPDVRWEEAVAAMHRHRVRHLPVLDGRRVIGIITSRMLMSQRTEFLDRLVEQRTRQLKAALDEVMSRDAELRQNLRAAARFQTRLLLPHAPPEWPELRWGFHYAFLIADASGHSIAATMVAIMSRIAFSDVAGTTTSPGAVLSAMNVRLQGLADERFVTAFYGVLNRRTRVLTYASAGHPYPLRYAARTGAVEPLVSQGFLLGIMPEEQYRERTVQLEPGDRLCFYTDGLIEARDDRGEDYGQQRLERALEEHSQCPAGVLTERLIADQRVFRGDQKLSDDVTLVVTELVP